MRRSMFTLIALSLLSCFWHVPVTAGPNANAKILVTLPNVDQNACRQAFGQSRCSSIRTAGLLYPHVYQAFVVVTDGDSAAGIGGVEFGISYDGAPGSGIDIYSWTTCATVHYPDLGWPASGTGNVLKWENSYCQRGEPGGPGTGVAAVVCYFYMGAYSPDCLTIIPRPADHAAKVASCAPVIEDVIESDEVHHDPSHLGFACFSQSGDVPGYNPCGLNTPVQAATWTSIKALIH